jgi:hypothetical protein
MGGGPGSKQPSVGPPRGRRPSPRLDPARALRYHRSMRAPIVVEEHAGLDRKDEPVSVGIPLERGAAPPGARLRVVDGSGAAVLAQTRPLARWSDGSLKWVLVDLLATVPARGRLELWLERAEADLGEGGLQVSHGLGEVAVRTGRLDAVLPRTGSGLASRLSVGGQELLDGSGLRLQVQDETSRPRGPCGPP